MENKDVFHKQQTIKKTKQGYKILPKYSVSWRFWAWGFIFVKRGRDYKDIVVDVLFDEIRRPEREMERSTFFCLWFSVI